ncbi:PAS domain S-box protein [Natronobiforma cellulositropha]|uniref:PAS domain S-box protein n=1 Tax=Natronobiforma cellulositropha TaxID=1679076 RepID=UPI0021D5ABF6|nr:PAS domain S-box protein [Natronobiforma cellulositropha]
MPAPNDDSSHRETADTQSVTVLFVGGDGETLPLEDASDEHVDVHRESTVAGALRQVDETDCLLVSTQFPAEETDELLETVVARYPDLPIVYAPAATDGRHARHLEHQLRRAVEHRRAATWTEHALTALQTVTDAVAIVDRTGTFAFVNRAYAHQFGYRRAELHGSSWTRIYDEDEAERLSVTAIPAVEDGWRWSGQCTGRRRDGETVVVRTAIVGLDDGGLVVTADEHRHGSSEVAAPAADEHAEER